MKYVISQMLFRNVTDEHLKNIFLKLYFHNIVFLISVAVHLFLCNLNDNKIFQMLPENSSCNIMYILLRVLLFLPLISCYKFFIVTVKISKIKKDQPIWLYQIHKQNFGDSLEVVQKPVTARYWTWKGNLQFTAYTDMTVVTTSKLHEMMKLELKILSVLYSIDGRLSVQHQQQNAQCVRLWCACVNGNHVLGAVSDQFLLQLNIKLIPFQDTYIYIKSIKIYCMMPAFIVIFNAMVTYTYKLWMYQSACS